MVEIFGWFRRHIRYPHDKRPRNVLVTFNDTNDVRWCTKREVKKMIEKGIVNFVTPQGGKTIRYVEIENADENPDLDS